MTEPKWKTKPYKIVGYTCIFLFGAIAVVDVFLAVYEPLPTISQYISRRSENQPLFGWIIIGILVFMGFHWFWGRIGKKR